jgi:hypothetical protein
VIVHCDGFDGFDFSPLSGWQFDLVDLMAKIVGIRSSSFCLLIYGPTQIPNTQGQSSATLMCAVSTNFSLATISSYASTFL